MKELANGLAQLAAIIMILITLAVSTAAVAQWAGSESSATAAIGAKGPQALIATDAR